MPIKKTPKPKEPKKKDPLVCELFGLFDLYFRHHNGYAKKFSGAEARAAKDLAQIVRAIATTNTSDAIIYSFRISDFDSKINSPTYTDGIYHIKQDELMVNSIDNQAFNIVANIMNRIYIIHPTRRKYEIHKFTFLIHEYIKEIKDFYQKKKIELEIPNINEVYI